MPTPLLPALATLFTLTLSASSLELSSSGDADERIREAIQATADRDAATARDLRGARGNEQPVMLALEIGRLGDDDAAERSRMRLGTSERVFGPVRPRSRLGNYTGRGLGTYTGRGLGSYTGAGIGGATTNGTGAATGATRPR